MANLQALYEDFERKIKEGRGNAQVYYSDGKKDYIIDGTDTETTLESEIILVTNHNKKRKEVNEDLLENEIERLKDLLVQRNGVYEIVCQDKRDLLKDIEENKRTIKSLAKLITVIC